MTKQDRPVQEIVKEVGLKLQDMYAGRKDELIAWAQDEVKKVAQTESVPEYDEIQLQLTAENEDTILIVAELHRQGGNTGLSVILERFGRHELNGGGV